MESLPPKCNPVLESPSRLPQELLVATTSASQSIDFYIFRDVLLGQLSASEAREGLS